MVLSVVVNPCRTWSRAMLGRPLCVSTEGSWSRCDFLAMSVFHVDDIIMVATEEVTKVIIGALNQI